MKSHGLLAKHLLTMMTLLFTMSSCSVPKPHEEIPGGIDVSSSIPPATPPSISQSTSPTLTPVETAFEALSELPLDQFIEDSYSLLLLRKPEELTALGISAEYGLRDDQLNDMSQEYLLETQQLEKDILALLLDYDRAGLSLEQQITYDVYAWYLDDRIRGHPFALYDYPINHFLNGANAELLTLFTELQPVTSKEEAEDYLTRLDLVDEKLDQINQGIKIRQSNGVTLPYRSILLAMNDLLQIVYSAPAETPYYTAFQQKLENVGELRTTETNAMLQRAETIIEESIIPAYEGLLDTLQEQKKVASSDIGVWRLPNGEDYYAYLLRHHTTTNLTADEIHLLGLEELERIHAEMRVIFDQLGYPEEISLENSYSIVVRSSGQLQGEVIVNHFRAIIEEADDVAITYFDLRPEADVTVAGGPTGGYYIPPSLDGSRPGTFYAMDTGIVYKYLMPSLAYHETIPGHHTQIALALELDIPFFQNHVVFNGYAEGWALYAEYLAKEIGLYEGDVYGDLGRLQYEALRAARMVVDTGIHSKGWTYNEAVDFMLENTGLDETMVKQEVDRMIVYPAQAVSYKVGMIKILELRQKVMDEMGEDFNLPLFHNLILGNGSVPLEILERIVEDAINPEQ